MQKTKLYFFEGVYWDLDWDLDGDLYKRLILCPKNKCFCELEKSDEGYSYGEYKYRCIRKTCDFRITFNTSIDKIVSELSSIVESKKYSDAEIVNIDGDLISVQRSTIKDSDYWVDVKISKDKKDKLQLMVLAGSKKDKEKTQLFLDIDNQKLSFDQNNYHPIEVFAKVVATFKDSSSTIDGIIRT